MRILHPLPFPKQVSAQSTTASSPPRPAPVAPQDAIFTPIETELADAIIGPLFKSNRSGFEEVLCGAYVLVESDAGQIYKRIREISGAYIRESSHASVAPQYAIKLSLLGSILTGVVRTYSTDGDLRDSDGKTFSYSTWFQLEKTAMWAPLLKSPSDFDVAFRPAEGAYKSKATDCAVSFIDMLHHGVVDYLILYRLPRFFGHKQNVGPLGRSNHHDENPLRARIN